MSGGFSFPPPPPPPPKAAQHGINRQGQDYPGGSRGRGRGSNRGFQHSRGQSSGRGNGFFDSGQHRSDSSYGWQNGGSLVDSASPTHSFGTTQQKSDQSRLQSTNFHIPRQSGTQISQNPLSQPRTAAGQKRKLDALKPPGEHVKKPGPPTAPAVPSFGALFTPSKQPTGSKTTPTVASNTANKPKGRSLGLTPTTQEAPASDSNSDGNDFDEESMYAELGSKLTFEHNGVVMSLKSQADLAAWKKERQKNWPTKTRMVEKDEERRRIGEERRRLLQTTNPLQRSEQLRQQRPTQQSSNEIPEATAVVPNYRANRLSELRKKVLDSQAKRREVKSSVNPTETNAVTTSISEAVPDQDRDEDLVNTSTDVQNAAEYDVGGDLSEKSSSESSSESSSDSSSESESDSDDDAPEEATSKPSKAQMEHDAKPVCKFFATRGHCRYGNACTFRHEQSDQAKARFRQVQQEQRAAKQTTQTGSKSASGRKGILQRLKEQEQEEEDRMALQVIKYLGKAGFFNDTPHEGDGV